MNRLTTTIQKDMIVQIRNHIYTISLSLAILFSVLFSIILKAEHIKTVIPATMLLIVGGTTLVFIGGLVLDEKENGILSALILSPLKIGEYLWSKIITLTLLSTIEVGIMIGGPIAYFYYSGGTPLPNLIILFFGVLVLNLLYTLLGIGLTVRYKKITDYMLPIVMIMIVLQLPIIFFGNVLKSPFFLVIPSSAPVMVIQGAFEKLASWEWIYAIGYNIIILSGLIKWAFQSYDRHIVRKMR